MPIADGERRPDVRSGENVLIGGGAAMGFRESDGELARRKFDAAIQSMKDDGTLNAMIAKWEVGSQW